MRTEKKWEAVIEVIAERIDDWCGEWDMQTGPSQGASEGE